MLEINNANKNDNASLVIIIAGITIKLNQNNNSNNNNNKNSSFFCWKIFPKFGERTIHQQIQDIRYEELQDSLRTLGGERTKLLTNRKKGILTSTKEWIPRLIHLELVIFYFLFSFTFQYFQCI